jgi:hypothetical protein
MVWVVNAALKDGYNIYVEFNNGECGIIDFYGILKNDHRLIIRELLDIEKFKTAKAGQDTVCWENGVDFAPEFLYEKLHESCA